MGKWLMATSRGRVPHHGPVGPECPVECLLLTVLSRASFNPLARACDTPSSESRTVGDVLGLHARRQLRKIRGIGPRRATEIEAAMVFAGLDLAARRHYPRAGPGHRMDVNGGDPPAPTRARELCGPHDRMTESPRPGTSTSRGGPPAPGHWPGRYRPGRPAIRPGAPPEHHPGRHPMATSTATRRHAVHRPHPLQPPRRPPRAVLDLGAVPTAPGCARAWAREILWEWQLARLADAAEVVVSELVTNAMLTSRRVGRPFLRLILTRDQGELVILVRDYCPGIPRPRDAGEEDENGRGLLLVAAMSGRSGWYPPDDGTPGKVVWAALAG